MIQKRIVSGDIFIWIRKKKSQVSFSDVASCSRFLVEFLPSCLPENTFLSGWQPWLSSMIPPPVSWAKLIGLDGCLTREGPSVALLKPSGLCQDLQNQLSLGFWD